MTRFIENVRRHRPVTDPSRRGNGKRVSGKFLLVYVVEFDVIWRDKLLNVTSIYIHAFAVLCALRETVGDGILELCPEDTPMRWIIRKGPGVLVYDKFLCVRPPRSAFAFKTWMRWIPNGLPYFRAAFKVCGYEYLSNDLVTTQRG
jgi:hypothetical protein